MNEFERARRTLKAITRLVDRRIALLRPTYRYANVTELSLDGNTCSVVFPGETDSFKVSCGSVTPTMIGQTVRIEGQSGDWFVTDIPGLITPLLQPGMVVMRIATSVPPPGLLFLDGSIYNIADYTVLGPMLGSLYGGDGIATFGVPDWRGVFPRGASVMGGGGNTIGASGGLATHSHPLSDNGQAQVVFPGGTNTAVGRFIASAAWTQTNLLNVSSNSTTAASRSFGAALMGVTDLASSLPPYRDVAFLVKT